jgi:hypothetical protein
MEVIGQLREPAALSLGTQPSLPFVYEAGWAPEPVKKRTFLPGIELRFFGRPASRPLLYRLKYLGSHVVRNKTY